VGTGFQHLSVELGFWIPIVSGIPDSLSCIPDSKTPDSGFHKQKFPHSGIQIILLMGRMVFSYWIRNGWSARAQNASEKFPIEKSLPYLNRYISRLPIVTSRKWVLLSSLH